jgi:hypothetical protein
LVTVEDVEIFRKVGNGSTLCQCSSLPIAQALVA